MYHKIEQGKVKTNKNFNEIVRRVYIEGVREKSEKSVQCIQCYKLYRYIICNDVIKEIPRRVTGKYIKLNNIL